MDLRYQNLPGASFTIDIVHAGLYIIEVSQCVMLIIVTINTTGATSGAGTAYPSGVSEFTTGF
jgi:hypothetical protein